MTMTSESSFPRVRSTTLSQYERVGALGVVYTVADENATNKVVRRLLPLSWQRIVGSSFQGESPLCRFILLVSTWVRRPSTLWRWAQPARYGGEELERISAADAGCTRIRQIPGVGPVVATAIVVAIGDGATTAR